MDRLPTRVDRGARFLDGYRPGWHDEVDPDKISITELTGGVLGHLYGCMTEAPKIPEFTSDQNGEWSSESGMVRNGFFTCYDGETRTELIELWRNEIRKRRRPR